MDLREIEWTDQMAVADIVNKDYRAGEVFRRYNISYCCGGKSSLAAACDIRGLNIEEVMDALRKSTRNYCIPNVINFEKWDVGFLSRYIVNVHHDYLNSSMPGLLSSLDSFVKEHVKRYPYLVKVQETFSLLNGMLYGLMKKEEEVIFPYIQQVLHTFKYREPYAGLFIRTLRKPVEAALFQGHEKVIDLLFSLRHYTNKYNSPENACLNHKVVLSRLKELDNDLMQHIYLETKLLYPKLLEMEKELLASYGNQNREP
jgi:regulator of cell morphogenesis and NO signaling